MTVDNFSLFRDYLEFKEPTDRYIVHVLCRPKDIPADRRVLGANEHQRLIRTYYVDNLEYFDKKIPAIKALCEQNHARAYILPQVRNNYECLLNLAEKVIETIRLGNFSVKPEHLMRSAYCEYHKSRAKRWIIDLDADNLIEFCTRLDPAPHTEGKEWCVEAVMGLIQENLTRCGKDKNDAYIVPTRSGWHIVTPPFDLQTAFRECSMLFEGEKSVSVGAYHLDATGIMQPPDTQKVSGWLHKDGMSLLYFNDGEP